VYAPRNSLRKNISENGSTRRSVSVSARSSSDEDSSDDSDYESSDDDAEKTPLPALRPSGATEAVRYDCVKALWRPRGRPASGDDIRDGLKDFWELFQTIRDRWKSDSAAVKQAEDSKKNHEVPLLKERVAKQRQLAGVSLRAAMDQGHPDIVEQYVFSLPPNPFTSPMGSFRAQARGCFMSTSENCPTWTMRAVCHIDRQIEQSSSCILCNGQVFPLASKPVDFTVDFDKFNHIACWQDS